MKHIKIFAPKFSSKKLMKFLGKNDRILSATIEQCHLNRIKNGNGEAILLAEGGYTVICQDGKLIDEFCQEIGKPNFLGPDTAFLVCIFHKSTEHGKKIREHAFTSGNPVFAKISELSPSERFQAQMQAN